jgi:uncharacterized protein YggE
VTWKIPLAAVAAAATLTPAAARAQAPATGKSVTAVGTATVSVKPDNRKSNASIKAAVEAAEKSAQPKAIADARTEATGLAAASGLTLGGIVSVSNAQSSPFYGPFYYPSQGTFGPGKYCGEIRTSHLKHLANGKTKRVLGKKHRVCRVPPAVTEAVTVTFAAS